MRKRFIQALGAVIVMGSVTTMAVTGSHAPTNLQSQKASIPEDEYEPDDVSELKAVWNPVEKGFDISFKAPTGSSTTDYDTWDTLYGTLASIEKIEVGLDNGYYQAMTVLHTFTNPQPGASLSYCEKSLEPRKSYTFKVVVYANAQSSYGTTSSQVYAGAYPAAPENVTVTTTQGQMPVKVTFTTPTKYQDIDLTLPSLTKAVLETAGGWYSDPEQLAELTSIEPGKSYTMTVNKSGISGSETWKLLVYNEDGPSSRVDVPVYIGVDTPGAVTNLSALEQDNGDVLISWDAPVKGAHNGYFEAEGLKYVVKKVVGNSSTVIADNHTATSYIFSASDLSEPQLLGFTVTAVSAAGDGTETKSPELIAGPALALPFTETFDRQISSYSYGSDHLWATSTDCASSYPPSWRVYEYAWVGNDQVMPESGQGALMYIDTYSSTPVSNFYLTSSKINVEGQTAVELSYSLYVPSGECGNTSLTSQISFDNGNTYTTVNTGRFNDIVTKGWNKITGTAVVPAGARNALVRMVAHNDPLAKAVIIDNVSLKSAEAPAVVYPSSVTDFTAVHDKARKCITLSMKAPLNSHPSLGDVNNEPLTRISAVKISRQIGYGNDYVLVHTFDNPTPGATLTWDDTDLEQCGEYSYRALVYVGDNSDYGNYPENVITIGQIPVDVTGLKASSTRGSAPVVVTFTTPAVDITGEPLEALKGVSVTRYNDDTFTWDEIANLTDVEPGKTYDVTDANVTVGNQYEYRVIAQGNAGNAYGITTSVYVGIDEPETPSNVVARIGDDGHVVVTWDAPTAGVNGGYIDTEHLTYIVLRGNGYSDYNATMLANGVVGTTYTDATDFGEEEIVKYFVKAISNNITGYSSMSNNLLVGNPSQLPFIENFDKRVGDYIEAEHASWSLTGSEETTNWAFAEMAYFIYEGQVTPVDGGSGLAYAYYGPYSTAERDDYLTSGNIDVADSETPCLSFYVYGVPGYNNSLTVNVAFDGGNFAAERILAYDGEFDAEGWKHIVLPIEKPAGAKKMQVQFHAHKGSYSCSVAIDNIRVDSKASSISATDATHGILVAAAQGRILVQGAADARVVIADLAGRVIYTGIGDCAVPAGAGTYVVRVGATSVKLIVR